MNPDRRAALLTLVHALDALGIPARAFDAAMFIYLHSGDYRIWRDVAGLAAPTRRDVFTRRIP